MLERCQAAVLSECYDVGAVLNLIRCVSKLMFRVDPLSQREVSRASLSEERLRFYLSNCYSDKRRLEGWLVRGTDWLLLLLSCVAVREEVVRSGT